MTRSGIPTTYAGTNFRSRLEARWAAFFDLVGWRWTYEPIDADGYIPDFLVRGDHPFFVEVGPCVTWPDYFDKKAKADERVSILDRDVLIVGVSPIGPREPYAPTHQSAGLMGEPIDGQMYAWDPSVWGRCLTCDAIGAVHTVQSYCLRPCGHHQSGGFGEPVDEGWIEALWRSAGNNTQWNRPESIASILTRPIR